MHAYPTERAAVRHRARAAGLPFSHALAASFVRKPPMALQQAPLNDLNRSVLRVHILEAYTA